MTDTTVSPTQEPMDVFYINNLDALKVISDRRRLQLLEKLMERPYTVKQLASELAVEDSTKLYYHVRLLEEHEFIRVVDTQLVSGILENTYRATARRYEVEKELLPNNPAEYNEAMQLVSAMFSETLEELKRLLEYVSVHAEDTERAIPRGTASEIARRKFHLTHTQADEFIQKMREMVLSLPTDPGPDTLEFGLTFAFFPIRPDEPPQT